MKKDYALGISRLQRLVQHLNTIDKTNLNMWSWVESDVFHENPPEFLTAEDIDCGTTCCAFGHAATIPEFMEAGLRLVPGYAGDSAVEYHFEFNGSMVEPIDVTDLATEFFQLPSVMDARFMFVPWEYGEIEGGEITIPAVVAHIEHVITLLQHQLSLQEGIST